MNFMIDHLFSSINEQEDIEMHIRNRDKCGKKQFGVAMFLMPINS